MFENIGHFFKRMVIKPEQKELGSKDAAKERLHLVLMQDRANVSADFLELMKQEIIDVIKKYIVVDESSIDVRLTNQSNDDGTNGAPSLYANIPIVNIKNDMMAEKVKEFKGVDFNKEMGIYTADSEEGIDETENITRENELSDTKIEEENANIDKEIEELSKQENNEVVEKDINNENMKNEDEKDELDEIEEEPQDSNVDYVDDEDDDDDVTFDDLLKAAEEEEKNSKKD